MRRPSVCTVRAPHSPRSHAFLMSVSPSSSRNASNCWCDGPGETFSDGQPSSRENALPLRHDLSDWGERADCSTVAA